MKSKVKGGTKMTGGVKPADPPVKNAYSGGSSNVAKEAMKRADGGPVTGKMAAMRLDRPGRKMGGRVGADCSPLSSAATTSGRSDTRDRDD